MNKPNLYPEMNKKIVELLRISDEPVSHYAAARIEQLELELEGLTKRTVPDMSLMTHNDQFQLKMLTWQYGADYIVNAARHVEYLRSRKGVEPDA